MAEHKNYALLLWGLSGIGFVFSIMWAFNLGDIFENLLYLLIVALLSGPVVGILFLYIFSITINLISKELFKGKGGARNTQGIVAYSCIPIVLTLVTVLPVELIVFGIYMFSNNPSPMIIKPVPYVIIISLDIAALLWSIILLAIGLKITNNFSLLKSVSSILITLVVFLALTFSIFYHK